MNFRVIAAAAVAIASIGFGAGTAHAAPIPSQGATKNVRTWHPSEWQNPYRDGKYHNPCKGDGTSSGATTYKVRKGDTLWRISVRMYGPSEHAGHLWTKIAKANHIHGTKIRAGRTLYIPR